MKTNQLRIPFRRSLMATTLAVSLLSPMSMAKPGETVKQLPEKAPSKPAEVPPSDQPEKIDLPNYGIHFDSSTGNYFTNGSPAFAIRSVDSSKHVDRIEVSINDSNFETYKGQLIFKAEGLQTVRFRAVDPVLNWSPVQTFRVFVDLQAPKSIYTWQGVSYKNGEQVFIHPDTKFAGSAEDNLAGVKQQLVQIAEDRPRPLNEPLQFKKEGPHQLKLAALDNVGNQEKWIPINFQVDATAPETKSEINGITQVSDQKTFVNYGARVALKGEDRGAGLDYIEYQINDSAISKYVEPLMLTDKLSRIRFRSVDRVGNREEWKSVSLHQDSVPPVVHMNKDGKYLLSEGKIYALPGFSFNIQSQDDGCGVAQLTASRDGKQFDTLKPDTVIKFDQPGTYQFQVKAVDHVGNRSESAPLTVVIDDKAPKTKLKARNTLVPSGEYFLSGIPNVLDFTGEDEGVGLKTIEISYDGNKFMPLNGPLDLATWTTNRQTLYYRGIDALGNREEPQKMTVEIATVGPKVDLFVETNGMPQVPISKFNSKNGKSTERVPSNTTEKAKRD